MAATFKQFKKKALKNPDIKAEYDKLSPEYEAVKATIKHRIKRLMCL